MSTKGGGVFQLVAKYQNAPVPDDYMGPQNTVWAKIRLNCNATKIRIGPRGRKSRLKSLLHQHGHQEQHAFVLNNDNAAVKKVDNGIVLTEVIKFQKSRGAVSLASRSFPTKLSKSFKTLLTIINFRIMCSFHNLRGI